MQRTSYQGAVRDSEAERERDAKMLSLHESGLSAPDIAARMGVSAANVRARVKRAAARRQAHTGQGE